MVSIFFFFFSSRRRHTRYWRDWSSDVCSSDLQVRVFLVVAEGEPGVALQLSLGEPVGLFIYDRWDGDGDPLLFGPELSAGVLAASGSASARLLGRHVAVAVGVSRARVDRIGEDAVDDRS